MNATINLDKKELAEAVQLYLQEKGYTLTTAVKFDVETEYPDHGQGSPHPVFTGATVGVKPLDTRPSSSTAFLQGQGD